MFRILRRLSGLSPQEDAFKQYLRKAQEIERAAQDKKEETAPHREPAAKTDPASAFIKNSNLLDKLLVCKSPQRAQLTLEEAFYSLCRTCKSQETEGVPALCPGALIQSLMIVWDERPEFKVKSTPLMPVLRNMWVTPMTETKEYFGKFKRITKDQEADFSPFFYGQLGTSVYLSLVKGMGKTHKGVQLIRRVLDHMSAFAHVPSLEECEAIVEECTAGKWPKVLWVFLNYCAAVKADAGRGWAESVKFFRSTLGSFELAVKCGELAAQSGAEVTWEMAQPVLAKYLQHSLDEEAHSLFKRHVELVLGSVKSDVQEDFKQKQGDAVAKCYSEYIKMLIDVGKPMQARELFNNYLKDSTPKVDSSYEVGFAMFERTRNVKAGKNYFHTIKDNKKIGLSSRNIVAAMKMILKFKAEGTDIAEELYEAMFQDKSCYSPFALNLMIIFYGVNSNWEKVMHLVEKLDHGYSHNKHTESVINQQLDKCLIPSYKKQILTIRDKIKF